MIAMHTKRKAFTLIELLVVIAIIAILAAILFPVFAKAKEAAKKAKNLSGHKQLGLSLQIYTTDHDDRFPQAFTRRYALQTLAWNVIHPIPHNWKTTDAYWSNSGGENQAIQQWSNSTQPYAKNWGIHDDTGFNKTRSTADTADFAVVNKPAQPASQNIAFNGLLHTMSTTEIAHPSIIPTLWNGYGKGAYEGRSIANPTLACGSLTTDNCYFNPAGPPSGSGGGAAWFWTTGASAFVWGNGLNISNADTSTKWISIGRETGPSPAQPNTNYFGAPFAHILYGGQPQTMWFCAISGATVYYPCFFRPDKTQS
jgi:prepilin-type N-terminal cleavage/methylation domain-containing protein